MRAPVRALLIAVSTADVLIVQLWQYVGIEVSEKYTAIRVGAVRDNSEANRNTQNFESRP